MLKQQSTGKTRLSYAIFSHFDTFFWILLLFLLFLSQFLYFFNGFCTAFCSFYSVRQLRYWLRCWCMLCMWSAARGGAEPTQGEAGAGFLRARHAGGGQGASLKPSGSAAGFERRAGRAEGEPTQGLSLRAAKQRTRAPACPPPPRTQIAIRSTPKAQGHGRADRARKRRRKRGRKGGGGARGGGGNGRGGPADLGFLHVWQAPCLLWLGLKIFSFCVPFLCVAFYLLRMYDCFV